MADRKKPRMSRLSPEEKLLAKERRKETLREYAQSRHVVRLSDDTWTEWNRLKDEANFTTHDEFAVQVLQAWIERGQVAESKASLERSETVISETSPLKSRETEKETTVCTTPADTEVTGPSFTVSDVSKSNGGLEKGKTCLGIAASELETVKGIPGYKMILKAVLRAQIQQLLEQLAAHADEESVVLTASIAEGTHSPLGSKSGKRFLETHEDIKSQFLDFCQKDLHRHQSEKGTQVSSSQLLSTRSDHRQPYPKPVLPQKQAFPPSTSNWSYLRVRHDPYPVKRNAGGRLLNVGSRSLNVNHDASPVKTKTFASCAESKPLTEVVDNISDDKIDIKVECLDDTEDSNSTREKVTDTVYDNNTYDDNTRVKVEFSDNIEEQTSTRENSEVKANCISLLKQSMSGKEVIENNSGFHNEASFQSEAENSITGIDAKQLSLSETFSKTSPGLVPNSGQCTSTDSTDSEFKTQSEWDTDITLKMEVISESDTELEVKGVESQENHAKLNIDDFINMPFDPKSGISRSEGEVIDQQSHITGTPDTEMGKTGYMAQEDMVDKDKKLKPGQKKASRTAEEAFMRRKQALRMQKVRMLKQLKKIALKFKDQVLEPVDTLFIVKEKHRKLYKYFGCGDLVRKFEKGEVLMEDKALRSQKSYVEDNSIFEDGGCLTPDTNAFAFNTSIQESELNDIEINTEGNELFLMRGYRGRGSRVRSGRGRPRIRGGRRGGAP